MLAVAGPLVPVIDCEGPGGRRYAGHHQDALDDPGGDAPEGSLAHVVRVPKTQATGVTAGTSARSYTTTLDSLRASTASRLSATIQHVALCRTTAPRASTPLSRTHMVPGMAAECCVMCCGWHGMQGVKSCMQR